MTLVSTLQLHLSGLIVNVSHPDMWKIRIIGFFFEIIVLNINIEKFYTEFDTNWSRNIENLWRIHIPLKQNMSAAQTIKIKTTLTWYL